MSIKKRWQRIKKRLSKTSKMESFQRAADRLIKKGYSEILVSALATAKKPAQRDILFRLLSADVDFDVFYQMPDLIDDLLTKDQKLKDDFLAALKKCSFSLERYLCWIKFRKIVCQEVARMFLDSFNPESSRHYPEKDYAKRILIEIINKNCNQEITQRAWEILIQLEPSYLDLKEIDEKVELLQARQLCREKEEEEKKKARIVQRLQNIISKIEQ